MHNYIHRYTLITIIAIAATFSHTNTALTPASFSSENPATLTPKTVLCKTANTDHSRSRKALLAAALSVGLGGFVAGVAWYTISEYQQRIPPPDSHGINKKTAVVIDFDECLMTDHWYKNYKHSDIQAISPKAKDFGLSDPETSLRQLINIPGNHLVIASFGRKDIIKKALNSVLSTDDMNKVTVITPADFKKFDGCRMDNKNDYLQRVKDKSGIALNRMVFFDDTPENIDDAKHLGVDARHAKPFTDRHLHDAMSFIRKKSQG